MATIEEKAKDFACYNIISARDTITTVNMSDKYEGFKTRAEWMIAKAVKWLKENAQNYYEDAAMHDNCWYDDEQMIEDFQKAMEKE